MKRRDLIKGLTLLPLAGGVGSALSTETVSAATAPARDFFKELDVIPYINASGTVTVLSGSLMMPETLEAINATSHSFVEMYDLQNKVGAKIAEMLHCEAAMVTSGAAGAILLATAACITGADPEKIKSLPNFKGPRPEIVIQKGHRNRFDQQAATTGALLVEVEGPEAMEKAINANTVMAYFKNNAPPPEYNTTITHEQFVEIAKRHKVPSFIDAAADVPPVENLFKFQKMGFDLVTFSGGKMIRGPQSAGLLFGRKDLIEAAKLNHSPYEAPIGRPCKVNKEEMFGMYAALKSYIERDHKKEWQGWLDRIKYIASQVETIPTVKCQVRVGEGPANAYPGSQITWDQTKVQITPEQVSAALKAGKPGIIAGGRGTSLNVGVVLLQPEQVEIVARRVKEILQQAVQKS